MSEDCDLFNVYLMPSRAANVFTIDLAKLSSVNQMNFP